MTGRRLFSGDPRRRLLLVAFGLVAAQLAFVLLWVRPGPLSIDEVHYLWMVRGLVEGRGLGLPNGYEAFPSPELTLGFTYTEGGRITSQYPYGFPVLALPFYAVFGFLGLFVMNALAFVGVLLLTWKIGVRLLGSGATALLGCGVFVLASFGWEYSMAGWPHMTALLAELGAFWFLLDALDGAEGRGGGGAPALAAGLLVGLATTIRMDAVFLMAALGLPFLVARPTRWRSLGALALGFVPAALFLSVTNWLRWGNAWPLSYGRPTELARYLPLVLVGMAVLAAVWLLTRPRAWEWVRARPWTVAGAAAGGLLLALALPPTRPLVLRAAEGLYALLVDLRGQEAGRGATARREWALIYRGGLKKAFLQSCPWLPLAFLPFLGRGGGRAWSRALPLLALVPVVFGGVFVFFRWHGGMTLNLRYFLPTLPFLALLAAAGLREVVRSTGLAVGQESGRDEAHDPGRDDVDGEETGEAGHRGDRGGRAARDAWGGGFRAWGWLAGGVLLAGAGWAVLRPPLEPRPAELAVLDVPLLAALAVAVLVWVVARSGVRRSRAAPALLLAAGVALGWGGALAMDYDARWSRTIRSQNLYFTLEVAEHMEEGDLVHLFVFDVWGAIKEFRPGALLAFPRVDAYGDFRELTFRVLDRGDRVYAALAPEDWEHLRARGLLEGLDVRTVEVRPFPLAELRRARPPPRGSD